MVQGYVLYLICKVPTDNDITPNVKCLADEAGGDDGDCCPMASAGHW